MTTTETDRPNILLLFPDQLRFDWVGYNPDVPVRTPNLDKLSQAGMVFSKTVCPSPLCAPSRACLASGKEYDRCEVATNDVDYPLEQPTFYQLLSAAGYHVMGCGKFDLHKNSYTWGKDGKHLLSEWGFSEGIDNEGKLDAIISGADTPEGPYMHFLQEQNLLQMHVDDVNRHCKNRVMTDPTPLPDYAYCDNWLTQNGIQLLEQAPRNQPWFLQVNFTGPHSPWDITQSMTGLYRDIVFPQPANNKGDLTAAQHQAIRRNYSAMIENIDRNIGLLLQAVEARCERERTLIVFSSDHGEMLGDHGCFGKNQSYHSSVSVPLVICGADVVHNRVFSGPTTTLDLTATFLDYAGVNIPETMDSRSLRPILNATTTTHRQAVLSGLGNWRLIYDGRHKLVRDIVSAEDQLFDLSNDSAELKNLAGIHGSILERLQEYLPVPNSDAVHK